MRANWTLAIGIGCALGIASGGFVAAVYLAAWLIGG